MKIEIHISNYLFSYVVPIFHVYSWGGVGNLIPLTVCAAYTPGN